jgi:transcriptional regulator with XRE-family HTH domain/predicted nucleotidyltransferase
MPILDSLKLKSLIEMKSLTQDEVANRAGLSRGRINSLLAKESPSVHERTLIRLAQVFRLPAQELLLSDPLQTYKNFVAQSHQELDFRGLAVASFRPISLDDLFVPVRLRPDPADRDDISQLREPCFELPLKHWLTGYRRILVRGDPGSGKTTSLRHLAWSYAAGTAAASGYPHEQFTPIFVRLAEFSIIAKQGNEIDLVQFTASQARWAGGPDPEAVLRNELKAGRCLVLLDGLDEAGDQRGLVEALVNFVRTYPKNRFILSSRIVGLNARPWTQLDFKSFTVARWQDEEIREFLAKWCAADDGHFASKKCGRCSDRAEKLRQAFTMSSGVLAIASNPLMLTVLARLHHADAVLPRRRVDLYNKLTEVLLETWEAAKHDAQTGDFLHEAGLDARESGWLLAALALQTQRNEQTLVPRWCLMEFCHNFLRDQLGVESTKAKAQADRIVRYLSERSGLLVERGPDLFGFLHLSFQEYFASRGLLEEESGGAAQDIVGLLRPYLYHPRWQEVIRLVSAQLSPRQLLPLLRVILDDPDRVGRFLKRGPFLVLRCLADGAAVADQSLVDAVFSTLRPLGESRWLELTLEALQVLRTLRGTRFEARAEKTIKAIFAAARRQPDQREYAEVWRVVHTRFVCGGLEGTHATPGVTHTFPADPTDGRDISVICLGRNLLQRKPEDWYRQVFQLLKDPGTTERVKVVFVAELGQVGLGRSEGRKMLEELLGSDPSFSVRCESALALRPVAAQCRSTQDALLRALHDTRNAPQPRLACALALRTAAAGEPAIRDKLLKLLSSSLDGQTQACAILGLKECIREDAGLRRLLLDRLRSPAESSTVKGACADVLGIVLGEDHAIDQAIITCLSDADSGVRHLAAVPLGEALAGEKLEWSRHLAEQVESILMNTPNPGSFTLEALQHLAAARAVRGILRLESILAEALHNVLDRVAIAFVFGSVARRAQDEQSDIDLMIVGEARLKEITSPLSNAEHTLGRRVNPVIYSPESFRQRYHSGDPFLVDVIRNPKIFIKGSNDELRALGAERTSAEA